MMNVKEIARTMVPLVAVSLAALPTYAQEAAPHPAQPAASKQATKLSYQCAVKTKDATSTTRRLLADLGSLKVRPPREVDSSERRTLSVPAFGSTSDHRSGSSSPRRSPCPSANAIGTWIGVAAAAASSALACSGPSACISTWAALPSSRGGGAVTSR